MRRPQRVLASVVAVERALRRADAEKAAVDADL
jgi:hypothetical protein